jgi:hypothetical protein
MSMVFLANVQTIVAANVASFYTPYEHVTVDYPREGEPNYIVSAYFDEDMVRTSDFATAMDMAASFLKRAEPA